MQLKEIKFKIIAVVLLLVGVVALGGILFARGPVGSATVVHKDVNERVAASANRINVIVVATSKIPPASIKLPWRLTAKIAIKQIGWLLLEGHTISEYGEEYFVRDPVTKTESICLVRIFGDYVVTISVLHHFPDQALSNRFRASLAQEFPGYEIL